MKSGPVKAIVARKRPQKPQTNAESKPVATFLATTSTGSAAVAEEKIPEKVTKINKKNDEDILLNIAKVKKPEDSAQLSLNIDTSIDPSKPLPKFGVKKKKLSRDERKEFVMQRRIEQTRSKQNPFKDTKPQNAFRKSARKVTTSLFTDNLDVPKVGNRLVKPLNEKVFTGVSMSTSGLHPHLVKTLADLMQITELTTVQQISIPAIIEGRDVLVRSQTGSGKTLAYALPLVHKLQEIEPKIKRTDGIFALVIVPSRELAIQTLEVLTKLLKPFTWIVPSYVTGGEKRKSEKARLRKGVNILIGTPGRICDHIMHTESFKLDKLKYLILDEADRLFELGYEIDIKRIVDALNPKNPFETKKKDSDDEESPSSLPAIKVTNTTIQTVLLSATLTAAVHTLAGLALKNPVFIDTCDIKHVDLIKANNNLTNDSNTINENDENMITENIVIPETIKQNYVLVPPKLRLVTLSGLIAAEKNENTNRSKKIIIFFATEDLVDYHYDIMTEILTKKVIDSDDEDDDVDENDRKKSKDPIALLNNSDSELEDEEEYLAKTKLNADEDTLLGDVKLFK